MPPTIQQTGVLSFGYVAPHVQSASRLQMAEFWIEVGTAAALEIMVAEARSYEELSHQLIARDVDIAWLPPIPLVALERRKAAVPLVSHHRDGSSNFHCVIVARQDSPIRALSDLRGRKAAWVDPFSASGYVLPRIELFARGVDPRTAFFAEKFYRSHDVALRAVIQRRADFAATWAGLDASGKVVRAPWAEMDMRDDTIRVIEKLGAIPCDTIAVRPNLPFAAREKIRNALIRLSGDAMHHFRIRDLFGVDEFRPWSTLGYEDLRRAAMMASESGLLDGTEK
jgi:phosphate/phosphite/phosphonate ABC transporter binding protein